MTIKKVAMAFVLGALAIGASYAPPASARVAVGVSIGLPIYAPPAPIVERVGVRAGYVWAPGSWRWDGYRYGWRGGYWAPGRVGYRYAPGGWGACGPHWCYRGARWVR